MTTPFERLRNRIENEIVDSEKEWNERKTLGNYRDSERVPTNMICPGTQERHCSEKIRQIPVASKKVFHCSACVKTLKTEYNWDKMVEIFFSRIDGQTHKLVSTREDWRHHGLEKNNSGRSGRHRTFYMKFRCLACDKEDTVRVLQIKEARKRTYCNYCNSAFSDYESGREAINSKQLEKEKEPEEDEIPFEEDEPDYEEEITDLLGGLAIVDRIRPHKEGYVLIDFTCEKQGHCNRGRFLKDIKYLIDNDYEVCGQCASNNKSMEHLSSQIKEFLKENSYNLTLLNMVRKEGSERYMILYCKWCDVTFEKKYNKQKFDKGSLPRCVGCSKNNFSLLKKEEAETGIKLIHPKTKEDYNKDPIIRFVCTREGCDEIATYKSLRAFRQSVWKKCQKCRKFTDDQQTKLEEALVLLQEKGIIILNKKEIVSTNSRIKYKGFKSGTPEQSCRLKDLLHEHDIYINSERTLTVEQLEKKFSDVGFTLLEKFPGTKTREYKCECIDCGKEYCKSVKNLDSTCICRHEHRVKYATVLDKFEKDNCRLLTEEKYFEGQQTPLNFECWCGKMGSTTWKRAQKGKISCGAHREKKREETNKEKYGVKNQFERDDIKEKSKDTLEKKYGVIHNMQSAEVFSKMQKTSAQRRKKQLHVSGYDGVVSSKYEASFISEMLRYNIKIIGDPVEIENEIGKIWYKFKKNVHTYFPDFYLPEKKKIVEIKNWWSFERDRDRNMAKWNHLADNDFDFEVWFFDEHGCHTHTVIFDGDDAEYKTHITDKKRGKQMENIFEELTE